MITWLAVPMQFLTLVHTGRGEMYNNLTAILPTQFLTLFQFSTASDEFNLKLTETTCWDLAYTIKIFGLEMNCSQIENDGIYLLFFLVLLFLSDFLPCFHNLKPNS
jgi:hypothetical protein